VTRELNGGGKRLANMWVVLKDKMSVKKIEVTKKGFSSGP